MKLVLRKVPEPRVVGVAERVVACEGHASSSTIRTQPQWVSDMTKNLERAELVVMVCDGSDCKKKGAKGLQRRAKGALKGHGLSKSSKVLKVGCTGNCKKAPICGVFPRNTWIGNADEDDLEALIERCVNEMQRRSN